MKIVFSKQGTAFVLRNLQVNDAKTLGDFLSSLSDESKGRFGPHPLTHEHSQYLCQHCESESNAERLVLLDRQQSIVGYFILEHQAAAEEITRYAEVDCDIATGKHFRLAPVIADSLQNVGLASAVMKHIIKYAKDSSAHSIVLMGGTQSTNNLAVAFYKNLGFRHVTSYWTDIENYDMYLPMSEAQILQEQVSQDIIFCVNADVSAEQFHDLLQCSSLAERRPIEDKTCIQGMIENSNLVISAWQGEALIGIARSVTDFHYACYLSDLAVDQRVQKQGIGKALVAGTQVMLYEQCKLILLSAPAANNYYPKLGFQHNDRCWVLDSSS